MADNTILQPGQPSDSVRTLDRTGTGAPKTEVTQLDLGGPAGNRESLVQGAIPVSLDGAQFDDDGIQFVNPNAPSADISTATLQSQQLAALQTLAAAAPPPLVLPKFTGSIANATDVVGPISLNGATRVLIMQSGTHSGITVTPETSLDGLTWVGLKPLRTTTLFMEGSTSYALGSNATQSNVVDVSGWALFRLRATAWASGVLNVVLQPSSPAAPMAVAAIVSGGAGNGVTAIGFPVSVGGADGSGNARTISTDSGGRLNAVVQGTTGAAIDAVITAATAPANGIATLLENVTTAPSLTTGQSVMAQCDYQGSQFVKPYRRGQTGAQATAISATGATTIVSAGAAGIFNDITGIVITTAGLAAQTITISDGTLSWVIDYPNAAVAPGQPFALNFDPPLKATTAATAWTANQSLATLCHYLVTFVLQKAS